MNAPVVAPEVARFVAEVRAALDDLDAEVVEELTGGLEADLTDSLEASRTAGPGFAGADEASAATVLGDPVGYAAELRSSAGLPPRAPAPGALSTLGPLALAAALHERAARLGERVTRHPRWPAVRDFLVTLRPVWWVARAWVVYVVLADAVFQSGQEQNPFPTELVPLALLLALVVASVQLGRRSAGRTIGRWRWPVALVNLLAAVVFPFLAAESARTAVDSSYIYAASSDGGQVLPADGLYLNGNLVTNVLPYDANGKLLAGVQLFDQDGNPLALAPNTSNNTVQGDGLTEGLPLLDANGEARWNVFPLQQRPIDPALPVPAPSSSVAPVPTAPAPTVAPAPTEPAAVVPAPTTAPAPTVPAPTVAPGGAGTGSAPGDPSAASSGG